MFQKHQLYFGLASTTLVPYQTRLFTGKTESGFRYKTPTMRMRRVNRITPAPGMNLQLPTDLDAETFCRQIGGDCDDYSDKFESLEEVFSLTSVSKNAKVSWCL